jgi:hypothetical protein
MKISFVAIHCMFRSCVNIFWQDPDEMPATSESQMSIFTNKFLDLLHHFILLVDGHLEHMHY